jgi:hypothetical protein
MATLSAQDAQLAANDKVTLTKLIKLGLVSSVETYSFSAEMLGSSGLSTNALVALVRAPLPRLVDADGTETRPKTFVAKEVTVYAGGAADLTLMFDLVD